MSEETILPISTIFFFGDCDKSINLGNVGRETWSLHPKLSGNMLEYFVIYRSLSARRVEIKINLDCLSRFRQLIGDREFEACFEEGKKTVRIQSNWPGNLEYGEKFIGTLTIYDYIRFPKFSIKTPKAQTTVSQLSDDLLLLFNNPDSFPDATLKCGTAEMPVHKSILSVRSPVFAAMFKSKMQESQGDVDIVDIEEGVLKDVLKFIYSGKADPLTDVAAEDLLFAADKYQLEELKLICIEKLKSSMTVNNVSRILVLGHLHDESLKSYAKEFICNVHHNFPELENTEEWGVLEKEHPQLAIEVLKSAVIKCACYTGNQFIYTENNE